MNRGRRLAFDYGDVRIGVAVSDPDCILASPLPVLRSQSATLKDEISNLIFEYEPIQIFVGLPKHLSGNEGSATLKVRTFIEFLEKITHIPIELIDERLSTVSAQGRLRDSGVNAKDSKELIDSMSAVLILESGIAREQHN